MRLSSGNLLFLHDAPEYIEGYVRSETNPAHFIQMMPPCTLRRREKCGTCRTPNYKDRCTIGRPLDCVTCPERVE